MKHVLQDVLPKERQVRCASKTTTSHALLSHPMLDHLHPRNRQRGAAVTASGSATIACRAYRVAWDSRSGHGETRETEGEVPGGAGVVWEGVE